MTYIFTVTFNIVFFELLLVSDSALVKKNEIISKKFQVSPLFPLHFPFFFECTCFYLYQPKLFALDTPSLQFLYHHISAALSCCSPQSIWRILYLNTDKTNTSDYIISQFKISMTLILCKIEYCHHALIETLIKKERINHRHSCPQRA